MDSLMTTAEVALAFRDGLLPSDRVPLEQMTRASKFFREDEVAVAVELIEDSLTLGEKSEYRFIVAVQNGAPVGYCCYGFTPCTLHSYQLYWIVVSPAVQRRGIGRRLLAAVEERVRAAGGRRLYVETSNTSQYEPTRLFYLSCGYRAEAILRDFYAPGDDKVIFGKVLA